MTKRKRRLPNRSVSTRLNRIEDAIDELKEALIPTEIKAVFWAPGLPEPDMDNLPKGHTVIRFVSESEIKELDQAERQKLREELDARAAESAAEREAEAQAEITPDPPPSPPERGDAKEQETRIVEPASGVRWGFAPRAALEDTVRSHHRFTGLARML